MIHFCYIVSVVSTFAGSVLGYADGVGSNAKFYSPTDLTVDVSGVVHLTDYSNNRIRSIASSGAVSTVSGSGVSGWMDGLGTNSEFRLPRGICVHTDGTLFVSDSFYGYIRKITSFGEYFFQIYESLAQYLAGLVSTLAGSGRVSFGDGLGTAASFNVPRGLAFGPAGLLYLADSGNRRIRVISSSGMVCKD